MANEKLIYASDARGAILRADPRLSYLIDNIKGVDAVEVVHGHWLNLGGQRKMDLYCSVCDRRASNFVGGYEDWWDLWMPRYCPNCGAKMDGDGNDKL